MMDLEWLGGMIEAASGTGRESLVRFGAEAAFVRDVVGKGPGVPGVWEELLRASIDTVRGLSGSGDNGAIEAAVKKAEGILSPLAPLAKEHAIHCVGHAHIDMNWQWSWQETVATVNDTFTTVVRLMEEFPSFRFSQSQASVYLIMKEYLPELYERVKALIAQGRWEVTACQWVEGDKNMASGEIICRHLLYTRRFMEAELGLKPSDIPICWEPDTFGHPHTLPTILRGGGAKRYYLHRAAHGPSLFWWQGKDGSRVLVFDDDDRAYNGVVNENITRGMADFAQATGMKDYIFVYGVGDHGGGPTKRDIMKALEMNEWPIFPRILLSTTDAFFSAAERDAKDLPVIDGELNTVFEGCYTSQSVIKLDNRKSENALVEAELYSLMGRATAGLPYPKEALDTAWRHTMLNQFHDILPGSGTRETYRHADGLFQEVMALTGMAKTRALRAIAERIDTSSCAVESEPGRYDAWGPTGMGAGVGDGVYAGAVSTYSYGNPVCDAFAVFNPNPWSRTEVVRAKLWDKDFKGDTPVVRDGSGNTAPVQVLGDGWFWGHRFTEIAFPAGSLPAMGYKAFAVGAMPAGAAPALPAAGTCGGDGKGTIWNEFLEVTVDPETGAVSRLIDKRNGVSLVPDGARLGALEYVLENPHPMSSWIIGSIAKREPLANGGDMECPHNGPYLASVVTRHKVGQSSFALTISLGAGVPRVDFLLDGSWYERGSGETGVPSLRVSFPLSVEEGKATFEVPNGHVERPTGAEATISHTNRLTNCYNEAKWGLDPCTREVPAQKWVDLSGGGFGAALVNDSKYGFEVTGGTMGMSLIRSSYDPDPVPEQGRHTVAFALIPHAGDWSVSDSTRAGFAFNQPLSVVGTGIQKGCLATEASYGELLTPNAMLSGIKRAEDDDSLVVRLYETEGKAVRARVRLSDAFIYGKGTAVQTDTLEQPLPVNTATLEGGILSVDLPAFGMATVVCR